MPRPQRRPTRLIAGTSHDQRYSLASQVNNGPNGYGYDCPNGTRINATQVGTELTVTCGCHGVKLVKRYEGLFDDPNEVFTDFNDNHPQ